MLSAPRVQALWENPYRSRQRKRWKPRSSGHILQQQRLEKAAQRFSDQSCDSRSDPMEHQTAITFKIGNAMLYLQQFRASGNAPRPPYSQKRRKETCRHQHDPANDDPQTTYSLYHMTTEDA